MQDMVIKYRFLFGDNNKADYVLTLDGKTLLLKSTSSNSPEAWTNLSYNQCSNCPFNEAEVSRCPVAVNLSPLINFSDQVKSYDEVKILVVTKERNIQTKTTMQRALSSILGLIMATSDCPHMYFFRSLARFHLPFADSQETIFRSVSAYLLAQCILSKQGKTVSFEISGLNKIYKNLQTVNKGMAARIKTISSSDATTNAVVLLDLFAKNIPNDVDELVEEVSYLFQSYIEYRGQSGQV